MMASGERDQYYPRIIVWALNAQEEHEGFSTPECMLTIESIAQLAKPIVVLTGLNLTYRPDLYDIVEYGTVLGLKIIIEARPNELTDEILRRYSGFGPKLFRLIVDGAIVEDPDTRFKQSLEFRQLQDAIRRLRNYRYEVHLGVTSDAMSLRQLAFYHDFAYRSVVQGLYCHLAVEPSVLPVPEYNNRDEIVEALAKMKGFSPKSMYISPQCIKYGPRQGFQKLYDQHENGEDAPDEWNHFCQGGRTYAFIETNGNVQVCANYPVEGDNLRSHGYNFKELWETSQVFQSLRERELTCSDVQDLFQEQKVPVGGKVEL